MVQMLSLLDRQAAERAEHAARRVLGAGGLVAMPTETVYGLFADASDPQAVARIFAAKGRPRFNPLIAHVDGVAMAEAQGALDATARRLADWFWPGPLTLVVPRAAQGTVCDLARAGLDSVALRVPRSGVVRRLARDLGRPLAGPSANRSGRVSPTLAAHVAADLGEAVDLILDGGPCPVGVESTVLACLSGAPRLLRPGGIPAEEIEAVLGVRLLRETDGNRPASPGQLASHYAPRAGLRLDAREVHPGEALLAFGAPLDGAEEARAVENLSPTGDLLQAAARLYGALRRLDESGAAMIAAMPIPRDGLGEAINDRLARAAAPRPKEDAAQAAR